MKPILLAILAGCVFIIPFGKKNGQHQQHPATINRVQPTAPAKPDDAMLPYSSFLLFPVKLKL